MTGTFLHVTAPLIAAALLGLTGCSGPITTTSAATPSTAFYWSAAHQTYAAGDYIKAADNLEHLIEARAEHLDEALPEYLVLTSGIAAGYMELADSYSLGGRVNKASALEFHRKASEFRNLGSRFALRFGQDVDKMNQLPLGVVRLAFGLPKGNAAPPPVLKQISRGMQLPPADAEAAQVLAIQRNVLLATCLAAGAPNDLAKTEEILARPSASVSRVTFAGAISSMLERESTLYARDKLDDPEKLAIFRHLAQNAAVEGSRSGSARLVPVVE